MAFAQNIPFFCIMLSMFSGTVSSVLPGKWARRLNAAMLMAVVALSGWLLQDLILSKIGSYTYMMGHFPAPWGNELRIGVLEACMALFFSIIMLLSLLGGRKKLHQEVEATKHNIYYILCNLLLSSLLALIYTNDVFTAYVFIEINAITACAIVMARRPGHSLVASVRYLVISCVGSGLFLMGITLLYTCTGQLLMHGMDAAVQALAASGEYRVPLLIAVALVTMGLVIKSALFPFHTWVPDAYGFSTPTSAAVLSSLVSKGYIFLLIKIMYRVIGLDVVVSTGITDVLFAECTYSAIGNAYIQKLEGLIK